ncbi:OpgC domain-containing protein [Glutamicibacter sp.]|uniref:OpgC domain-containing protein n=1 Tax=Glutamicibacter sp. TaxID=1931995 RepID=UPI002FE35616
MSKPHWTVSLWIRIQEPRLVSVVQTLIYALCFTGGLVTILDPPRSIEGAFGNGVTLAWGLFALIGGAMGAYSAPTGKWLIEKPAIIACATAITLYAGILVSLHITETGNRIPQLVFVLIGLLHFVNRYWRIKPYSYEPGK